MTSEPSIAMVEMTGPIVKAGKAIRFKLLDKVKFIDRIMRNLGLYPEEKKKDGFDLEADKEIQDAIRRIVRGEY